MAPRQKVLHLSPIHFAFNDWAAVGEVADIIKPKATNRQEFIEECRSGAFDGVTVAYRSFDAFNITGLLDHEVLKELPKTLKFICSNGAGYDQLDVDACTAHSVFVSNTPSAVDDATADIGIFLMLGALRGLSSPIFAARAGHFRGITNPPLAHDPQGKTLGILGMGGIGRNMARKARAFGMRIRYHNRKRLSPELEEGAEYVSFEQLLGESDVLSLNLPLNAATRHTISHPQFALMKPGIVIVNTARGAVMDEAALVDALNNGTVSSVGLDVFEKEPEIHPGLIDHPRALLLPHMGTWTVETQTLMEEWAIGNVLAALKEQKLTSVIPEQQKLVSWESRL